MLGGEHGARPRHIRHPTRRDETVGKGEEAGREETIGFYLVISTRSTRSMTLQPIRYITRDEGGVFAVEAH